MRKNGFTLIELLAVIVILAIIALIAIPIILNIINDSKTSSDEQALELYLDALKKSITRKQLSNPNFYPNKCDIKLDGYLECFKGEQSLGIVEINIKGNVPNSGKIIIKNNKYDYINIMLDGKRFYPPGKLIDDADNNRKISIGDKYIYKVDDVNTFNFYVLSFNDDGTINLIMDRNICEDGSVATSDKICTTEWDLFTENSNGPLSIMTKLYNATKKWMNVPNMNLIYNEYDETENAGKFGLIYGYSGIEILDGVGKIIKKNREEINIEVENNKPIKARLPRYMEIYPKDNSLCTYYNESCPMWLTQNLQLFSAFSREFYPTNNHIDGIYGYWTLSASWGSQTSAHYVDNSGHGNYVSNINVNDKYGIRPVVTVSVNDLSN